MDEEEEEEEEDADEGEIAPVLGEEERATIPTRRLLKRQASAAGEFDYGVIGNRASDRFKTYVRRIELDPWDTDAWTGLVKEAQNNRGGGMSLKDVLRKFLKQFPTSGRYRRMLAQAEMESGDWQAADKVLQEGLETCASLELWLLYLERVRRSAVAGGGRTEQEAREDTIAAFELALLHVGCNPASTPLWQKYLDYIKSWEERSPLDKGNKMTAIRKVYRRVVALPLDGLEPLWRECEEFEMAGNEVLWKTKFSLEYLPKHMAAKAVYKERKPIWDGIDPNLLARPPRGHHGGSGGGGGGGGKDRKKREEAQAGQYRLWKRRLAFERTNPELTDEDGLRARVRHSYAQCLSHLRHFCEIWYDLAEYEYSLGEADRAAAVYRKAVEVIPGSDLLRVAQADLEERRGRIEEADAAWKAFLKDRRSTTGHVMYLRFVRRNMGKEAARRAFGATRALRRAGLVGYRLYLAHASIELHVNGEPEVARRVLEHGLSQHEGYVAEPEYVLEYIDFLVQRNDEENLRVLFERVLHPSAMPAERARLVWERFVQLELCLSSTGGSLAKAQDVERRMNQVYQDNSGPSGLLALWKRCSVAGCGMHPEGEVDSAFSDRMFFERREILNSRRGGNRGRDGGDGTNRDRSNPQGGNSGGKDGGKDTGSGGGPAKGGSEKGGKAGRGGDDKDGAPDKNASPGGGKGSGNDDEGWSRGDSSVSPLIPPFMRKLFMALPRHIGPQPDAEGLLKALRERALPGKPSAGSGGHKGKRRRNDSDDEDDGAGGLEAAPHKKPVRDIFRQRMQANLTPHDD
ncbi:conserved unknown protein [Ectocarpus siliculosus]|uniref:Suppressor of forked domain-containing protein n=1 Tax=Ectocarpus siliculosus TaxID=2880 RepID=D8LMJ6_ECTSI|nr:conserved unknown protein [Ectocarpus siliculosus]|eukprot:CBN77606.1 conserved unknown protein [Ectocarpus siliculosus]